MPQNDDPLVEKSKREIKIVELGKKIDISTLFFEKIRFCLDN